jgi:hypothetical protein
MPGRSTVENIEELEKTLKMLAKLLNKTNSA